MREYFEHAIARSRTPGLEYVAVDPAGPLISYAGGWADIGRRVSLDTTTSMMAYSMSKTITAAAVLQLAEAGRLGLDDPIDRHVEGLPYGSGVTVRRLLSHTAGVPSPIPLRWVHLPEMHDSFDERAALTAVLRGNPRLKSAPGSRYAYSNLGYWLLGPLVERASGEAFTAFVERSVLAPLGITGRDLGYVITEPAHHASGYLEKYSLINLVKGFLIDRAYVDRYEGRWLRIHTHYLNGPAFGGLVGTAAGFGRFLQDQLQPRSVLMSAETQRLFYQEQQTTSGRPVPMTLGWHIGNLNGVRYYFKEGGGGGFHSMMRVYRDQGVASAIVANATRFDVAGTLDAVDRQFFFSGGGRPSPTRLE